MFIERTEDKARAQLARLQAFTRKFRTPRGVVFRADGTLIVEDTASGVLHSEQGQG
ncbi:MAG: hypothetical protein ACRBN8_43215 [Nannocystales bacterium]